MTNTNKPVIVKLKIYIKVGSAVMLPPLGPTLSQYGINVLQFCKEFNEKTIEFKGLFLDDVELRKLNFRDGIDEFEDLELLTLPVIIWVYTDKTFSFKILKPTVREILIFFFNKNKYLNVYDVLKIAKFKFCNLNLYAGACLVKGVLRSLNIKIKK